MAHGRKLKVFQKIIKVHIMWIIHCLLKLSNNLGENIEVTKYSHFMYLLKSFLIFFVFQMLSATTQHVKKLWKYQKHDQRARIDLKVWRFDRQSNTSEYIGWQQKVGFYGEGPLHRTVVTDNAVSTFVNLRRSCIKLCLRIIFEWN